jgi:hypothetical protein
MNTKVSQKWRHHNGERGEVRKRMYDKEVRIEQEGNVYQLKKRATYTVGGVVNAIGSFSLFQHPNLSHP